MAPGPTSLLSAAAGRIAMSNEERLEAKARALNLNLLPLKETKEAAGKLLLSGWKMSEQPCPISEYPLFEKNGELFSVRLNLPVQREAGSTSGSLVSAKAEVKEEEDLPAPRPLSDEDDVIGKRIGEKLLLGWALLEDTCPVTRACPLMRDPVSRRLWTPALAKYIDEIADQQDSLSPRPSTQASFTMPDDELDSDDWICPTCDFRVGHGRSCARCTKPPLWTSLTSSSATKDDGISKRIGDKLLLGWEMLNENCPTGKCPLLRDPETGRLWSAATNSFLDTRGSLSQAKERATSSSSSTGATVSQGSFLALDAKHSRVAYFETGAPRNLGGLSSTQATVLRQVLENKLRRWTKSLDASEDFGECDALMGVIQKALTTLNML